MAPNLFYGTSIAVTLLVLSKKKIDTKTQFIDARGTISSKYAEAIILHASVWSEIGERIEALTSALA